MRQHKQRNRASTSWIPYFKVEDADGAAQTAEQSGGRILAPPADSPIGRTALLADPQGVTFAVLEEAGNVVTVDG